jgi:hypothetical protein
MRTTIGRVLAVLGVVCAVTGIFVLEGISIEFPGIILGGLGYSASHARIGWARSWASPRRSST